MNVCIMLRCHLHVQNNDMNLQKEQIYRNKRTRKGNELITDDNRERIRTNPTPIAACEERMLSKVVFDSTHTHGSSKYFLSTNPEK